MNILGCFLVASICALVAVGAFLLGRRWGVEAGRCQSVHELERRLRDREAYLEERLREYAGLLESAIHERDRQAAEMQDAADWWKNGGKPPGGW
jgi:hypothetical protein